MSKRSVFIIGAGNVGASTAQAIALKEIVDDIVLIDTAAQFAHGQALDLNHGTAYSSGVVVRTGTYKDIKHDDIIILACGVNQKPGQTRLDLLDTNIKIIQDVVKHIKTQDTLPYIVVISNPVDILTHAALHFSGLPKERVMGTGTTLDTARLRVALAEKCGVSQDIVEAYVFGEHGDSSFAALSQANIGGVPLNDIPGYSPRSIGEINDSIRNAVYEIIEAKHSTYYGIASVTAKIVESLLSERTSVFPVCSLAQGEYGLHDVTLGLPSFVSSKGVKIIEGYPFDEMERQNLHHSAHIIREHTKKVL